MRLLAVFAVGLVPVLASCGESAGTAARSEGATAEARIDSHADNSAAFAASAPGLVGRALPRSDALEELTSQTYAVPLPRVGTLWTEIRGSDDQVVCAEQEVRARHLAQLIRRTITPGAWGTGPPTPFVCSIDSNTLRVFASRKTHDEIRAYLTSLRWVAAWTGWEPAARQLVAMSRNGVPIERQWAASELRDAPDELRRAVDAVNSHIEQRDRAKPREAPVSRQAEDKDGEEEGGASRIRVLVRMIAGPERALHDYGVEGSLWSDGYARSGGGWLDDTKMGLLDDGLRRDGQLRLVDSAEIQIGGGDRYVVPLNREAVLTLRPYASGEGYIAAAVHLRFHPGDALFFTPSLVISLQEGRTLYLSPRDATRPDVRQTEFRLVLIRATFPAHAER